MDVLSSLTCEGGSDMPVTLQWTPPTNTGGQGVVITHYNITGLPQSASCSPGPCDMVDGTATTITGLQCNTSYTVAVRAVNCRGNGTFSEFIQIIVQPAPSICPCTTVGKCSWSYVLVNVFSTLIHQQHRSYHQVYNRHIV